MYATLWCSTAGTKGILRYNTGTCGRMGVERSAYKCGHGRVAECCGRDNSKSADLAGSCNELLYIAAFLRSSFDRYSTCCSLGN
jgi:hypothetical protein